jgi:branched-chain amino acid transport system ATP-binding protein
VSGLYASDGGTVTLGDELLSGRSQDTTARLGVARTFQNLQIFGSMTVLDNVLVGCHRHGRSGLLGCVLRLPSARSEERHLRTQAMDALDFVGMGQFALDLAAGLPPGRQRTVEIARAMALQPRLLLLDEPAAGLTTRETETLAELITRIAGTGLTTMLIEHDMGLVMGVCSRVAVLDQGRLLAEDTPSRIQADPHVIAAYLGEED